MREETKRGLLSAACADQAVLAHRDGQAEDAAAQFFFRSPCVDSCGADSGPHNIVEGGQDAHVMDSVRQSGTALPRGRLANAHSDGWLPGNRFRTTTRCTEESSVRAGGI